MAKLTLLDLANLDNPTRAVSTINANYDRIVDALENTLSRDGTTPNAMEDELNMDGQRIIGLPAPVSDTEPARHGDLQTYVDAASASADAAAISETNAAASEAAAAISEDNALTSEQNAAASEAAAEALADSITNYDLLFFVGGVMANSETLFRLVVPRSFTLPSGLTGSKINAGTAAAASTTVTIYKNGVSIGTLVWAISGTTPTITFSSDVSFAANDVLLISGPATADVSLADVSIALVATRT